MLRSLAPGAADLSNVADPDASGGRAAEVSRRTGYVNSWHNYRTLEPGDYEAVFRLKVSDNQSPHVIFHLVIENGGAQRPVRANEFTAPRRYQDFTVPFSITRPALVSTPIRGTAGDVTGWADRVTIKMLRRYSDHEQLRLLGITLPKLSLPASASGVLVVRGLYHEFWHTEEALAALRPQLSCVVRIGAVEATLRGFPDSPAGLARSRLVVLAGVPAAAVSLEQRAMLEAFVHAGGGLLVLGGPYAFGLGDWHTSDILSELLPVSLATHYDLVKCSPPGEWNVSPSWLPSDSGPAEKPVVFYRHRLSPKSGTEVVVTAGGEPLVVAGHAGRGRVVAVLATPLGEPSAGELPWWQWSDWTKLFARFGHWAAGGEPRPER